MTEVKFNLDAVTKKPSRRYRKGSQYDIVIETFRKGANPLVKVEMPGKDANYIRTQLKKRLDAMAITDIEISVVNATAYLEKLTEKPKVDPKKKPSGQPKPDGQPSAPAPENKPQ